jgi:hypothetical protein
MTILYRDPGSCTQAPYQVDVRAVLVVASRELGRSSGRKRPVIERPGADIGTPPVLGRDAEPLPLAVRG